MKLTAEELQAIRERAERATAGPWFAQYQDVKTESIRDKKYGEPETIAEMYYADTDAEFIAHAREDVPKLLALVVQQAAEVERLQAYDKLSDSAIEDDNRTKERLLAQISRMEIALCRIVNGEADSLGDAFRIAQRALSDD